jgi:hypothetical protein
MEIVSLHEQNGVMSVMPTNHPPGNTRAGTGQSVKNFFSHGASEGFVSQRKSAIGVSLAVFFMGEERLSLGACLLGSQLVTQCQASPEAIVLESHPKMRAGV